MTRSEANSGANNSANAEKGSVLKKIVIAGAFAAAINRIAFSKGIWGIFGLSHSSNTSDGLGGEKTIYHTREGHLETVETHTETSTARIFNLLFGRETVDSVVKSSDIKADGSVDES